MKSTFLSFTFLILTMGMMPASINAQTTSNRIQWSATSKLTWEDFKGLPDGASGDMASAHYDFDQNVSGDADGKINIKTFFTFAKSKSWKKANKTSDELLQHEQVSFDLGEVYARKLRKMFASYATTHRFSDKTKNEVDAIRQQIADECQGMNNQYEMETNNSRNKAKQAAWNTKVATMLQESNEWSAQ